MRIQHNITAMNAYRNYNTNTKALAKNLEKLSSGYRINRAGDDAAGLAISEKMRAQITGLEVAQKNAKDGISLVQTAEGAMTEVHDMLNRMYELAEQSSNGTYQNDVDREQMQKEIDSLSAEIDRIADSTNFNGINLLDGSLSQTGTAAKISAFELPKAGSVLGTDTILNSGVASTGTSFSIDLRTTGFRNDEDETDSMEIEIGSLGTIKIEAGTGKTSDDALDAAGLASAIVNHKTGADVSVSFTDKLAAGANDGEITIDSQKFTMAVDGTKVVFTQVNPPTQESEVISGDMTVKISEGTGAIVQDTAWEAQAVPTKGSYKTGVVTQGKTVGGKTTDLKIVYTDANGDEQTFNGTFNSQSAIGDTVDALVNAINGGVNTLFSASKNADNSISIEEKTAVGASSKISIKSVEIGTGNDDEVAIPAGTWTKGKDATAAAEGNATLDYQTSTTVITNGQASNGGRLASTVINLKKDMIADGSSIKIGDDTYTFTTDKDVAAADTTGKTIDISDLKTDDANFLSDAATRLTEAAKDNATWTVGHDDNSGKITLVETGDAPSGKYDTMEKIAATLGYGTAAQDGHDLILQIGDTSDSYNKLAVSINDMHTDAMKIGDIDISTQDGASDAMKKIQDAINYVSDTRGDLGSLQNRLDHTISNLSVMQENIQDAEATIRDVDVAEEMMAYTKNNILVQSAQAMLAQANQLPQGVLQLLQ